MPAEIVIPGGVEEWSGRRVDDFAIGSEHTVFEWCVIYTDGHPGAFLPNHNRASAKDRTDRLTLLGANWSNEPGLRPHPTKEDAGIWDDPTVFRTRNAVFRELAETITTGGLGAKRVYLDDRPDELDPTLCILGAAPVLAIARRRKDHGQYIARLLAEPLQREPRYSIKPDLRTAIKKVIQEHGYPGKFVQWPRFCDLVRTRAKVAGRPRGYGDKSIERAVRAIAAEQDKSDISDMSDMSC